jgi:FkbM family methyltransferase
MDLSSALKTVGKPLSNTVLAKSDFLRHLYLKLVEQSLEKNYIYVEYGPFRIWGQESEYVISQIKSNGKFEPHIAAFIYSELNENDTAVDIGSQWGVHLLSMSDTVGEGGRVFGFDPNPDHAQAVRKTIRENKINNIEFIEKGCGSQNINKELAIREDNSGASTFLKDKKVHSRTVSVDIVRLDEFFFRSGVDSIQLMKIDVEGMEKTYV